MTTNSKPGTKTLGSKKQFIDRLSKMRRNIYFDGHLIDRTDELQMDTINMIGSTYDFAQDPKFQNLVLAKSHITGNTINRFTHIHQSTEDLHKKQDMTRALCQQVGGCIQRCMGIDGANACNAISFEADKQNKGATEYHKNFLKWIEYFQSNDLVGCCAQTDVKGDRMKRPSQQKDPDLYLHIVERKSDGIVVSGCKVHNSEASTADEIIVVPTRSLLPEEKDWAVAFAIPADWEGIKQVATIHNLRERKHYKKGVMQGATDSYTIFDKVFIPWERVFVAGETIHGAVGALLFALFHRHSYSGCKPAIGDLMLGTVALAAEYNGIAKAGHVREKLAELIMVSELGYAAGFTASEMGKPEVYMPGFGFVPYGPGSFIPNSIYCNVGRCLTGEAVYREAEILCDVAGGIPATFPHEGDFLNPETKALLEKYTMRNPDIKIDDAIKLWMHAGDLLCSASGGIAQVGGFHGGGSPVMEQIAITTQYDIESCKKMAKRIAGIES
ncbi:MAG: aromatic ring hydroxylase [Dehalococcoidia bacterium]|nr:aromatic ring hydroxylase [Dehalococcoidia bacterium]